MPLSCQGNQDASLTPAGKFVNQIKIQISTMAQSAERSDETLKVDHVP